MSTPALSPISVEIFHDVDCGRLPTESTEAAIAYLGSIIGECTVINGGRFIRLTKDPKQPYVEPNIVRPRGFRADINFVLTERRIYYQGYGNPRAPESERLGQANNLGMAIPGAANEPGWAAIRRDGSSDSAVPEIHETAHLYGMKRTGVTKADGSQHCALPHCAMYYGYEDPVSAGWVSAEDYSRPAGLHDLGTQGEVADEKIDVRPFCDECTEQLGRVAFMRRLAKVQFVPPELLY
jgi:hypothetical protein